LDGKLSIIQDGKAKKFVTEVEHRTFSGSQAAKWGKEVIYITERCVFKLRSDGLELTEIAPGVDLQKDILDKMDFTPIMDRQPALMDARIFTNDGMDLRAALLEIPLEDRFTYDEKENLFFVNFEGLSVRSLDEIKRIEQLVEKKLAPIGHKVNAIVNYDRTSILPELVDPYIAMVKAVVERYYNDVTRYTSSAFIRMKLGEALVARQITPQIYETPEEAQAHLSH
jgi:propionate CoA-transferase